MEDDVLSEPADVTAVSDEEVAAQLAEEENERWSSGEYTEESHNSVTSEGASEDKSDNKASDDLDDLLNNRIYTDDNK